MVAGEGVEEEGEAVVGEEVAEEEVDMVSKV